MRSRQEAFTVEGLTQASNVIPVVKRSELASGTVTKSLAPSNESADPNLPAADHVAPETEPLFAWPETSATVPPLPSLKPNANTRPVGMLLETVTVTDAEVAVFPPVSRATAVRACVPLDV